MTGFSGLASCVHCGFCLQRCPTYVATGDEADGPRGRIVLMQRLERDAAAAADPTLRRHLDRCLGCRACEPVCPSGVSYGPALEAARAVLARTRPISPVTRLVLDVVASPPVRAPLLAAARALRPLADRLAGWGRGRFMLGMLAGSRPWRPTRTSGSDAAPPASDRGEVAVFEGCVQRDLFGHVNDAAARTLGANGYRVRRVRGQGCCGALHAHAGDRAAARRLARANVRAFQQSPSARIAATAAGCGATLKDYGALLADDPLAAAARDVAARVHDVTELLAAAGPAPGGTLDLTVAYDAPCHLVHAQGVADAPRAVLAAIAGLRLVEHREADACCGSAGVYSLVQPELARAVLERKLGALAAAAPDVVATGNPGCAMQIAAGLRASGRRTPVAHPVELLDAAYAAAGRYSANGVDSADR